MGAAKTDITPDLGTQISGDIGRYRPVDRHIIAKTETMDELKREWETSFLWYLRPELVDFSNVRDDCGGRVAEEIFGISGNPRQEASREFGEKWINIAVNNMIKIANKLLEECKATQPKIVYRESYDY